MARYGGDFGRYFQGMQGLGAGLGYGADYVYGADFLFESDYGILPNQGESRGGFYRGGARYGPGYGGFPRGESWRGYDRGFGAGRGAIGTWRNRYDLGFGGGYGAGYRGGYGAGLGAGYDETVGERGRRFGGAGMRRGLDGARQVRVADVMTPNPDAITPDTTIAEAAKKMKDLDVGIIPVVDDMNNLHLQGVITDRDIAVRAVAEGKTGKAKVSDCMTPDVESCRREDRVQDVIDVMRSEQVRRVPITDEDGRLVGIVAQADLAVQFAGLDRDREVRVEEAIERISEPARPRRGRRAERELGGKRRS